MKPRPAALHRNIAANVADGSDSAAPVNGCRGSYAPESCRGGHPRARPFRATTGLMHRSKQPIYSITSSASNCMEVGTVRPSAAAVFRLMTRSNLTGAWTGSSLGLAPRKTRST